MGSYTSPPSSGNVYADLSIPEPDVELAKSDLAIRIQRLAEHRRLPADEAATLLNVPKSDLAALLFPCSRPVQISSPLSLVSRSGSRSRLRWSVSNPTSSHDSEYSYMLELV